MTDESSPLLSPQLPPAQQQQQSDAPASSHPRPAAAAAAAAAHAPAAASRLCAPATACAVALLLGLSLAALSRLASAVTGQLAVPPPRAGYAASDVADAAAGAAAAGAASASASASSPSPSSPSSSFSWAAARRRHERRHGDGARAHHADCNSPHFTKNTLVLLAEYRVARLLEGGRHRRRIRSNAVGLRTFEVSDVVVAPASEEDTPQGARDGGQKTGRQAVYAVLDNAFSVLKIDARVDDAPGMSNDLLHWPGDDGSKSEFEAITYSPRSKSFAIVQEDIVGKKSGRLHAHVLDVSINATSNEIKLIANCDTDYNFETDNKGFEGATYIVGTSDVEYLLALCEGNHCAGKARGKEAGHGRLALLERGSDATGKCIFRRVAEINLPRSANFIDYSAITIYQGQDAIADDGSMTVAVASQASAALWVSTIKPVPPEQGYFQFGDGTVFDFPRNDNCQVVYCNIEGVAFLDRHTIVAVSDKMKSKGRQDFRCFAKAQSVHLFAFP